MLVFAIAPLKLHVPFLMHSYFIYNAAVIADKALLCLWFVSDHASCLRHEHFENRRAMSVGSYHLIDKVKPRRSEVRNKSNSLLIMPPPLGKGAVSIAFVRLSVRPSVAYIASHSRTQRP